MQEPGRSDNSSYSPVIKLEVVLELELNWTGAHSGRKPSSFVMDLGSVERLSGSIGDEKGGLIVKKEKSVFRKPQASFFGLDKLAEKKRQESSQQTLFAKRDIHPSDRYAR